MESDDLDAPLTSTLVIEVTHELLPEFIIDSTPDNFDNTNFPFVDFFFDDGVTVTVEFNGEEEPEAVRVLSGSVTSASGIPLFTFENTEIPIDGPFTNLFLRLIGEVDVIRLLDSDFTLETEVEGDIVNVEDWTSLIESWAEPEPSIDIADVLADVTIDMGTENLLGGEVINTILNGFDRLETARAREDLEALPFLRWSVDTQPRNSDGSDTGSGDAQQASSDEFVHVVTLSTPDSTARLIDLEEITLADGSFLFGRSEFADSVYRIYNASLDRTPDKPGFVFWDRFADSLGLGPNQTDKRLAEVFVDSVEFAEKFLGDGSDETYVNSLYNVVLGRDADEDPGGRDFWLGAFQSGALDRADMLVAFANSAENVAAVQDDIENGYWVLNA